MARALLLSLAQLGDRAILRVLLKSLLVTFLLLAALVALAAFAADRLGSAWWQSDEGLFAVAGALAALVAGALLFRTLAVAVLSFFADEIVAAVERRHYPAANRTRLALPFRREIGMALRSAIRAGVANAVALPLYLLLLVTGVGAPLLFIAVNSLLLSRDLGEMVGSRHLSEPALKEWLAASRRARAATGLVAALLFVVPVVNLLAPVLGAAIATHRFHGDRRA
ncbi:uncharacterized protein involved in cysteine biosynthesis [Sphingomonas jejuensis]|uniref:Uncharacterized protein involved in cysteine biosynthesis n=1 Tax=Sphingomonas jejuensis TaxID=904715 RepID=A0ABX0XN48_9SPHN|nr:EI24 domain-containing protein [Sphingomonas jejuensis]NJC34669.1 uncharacterized protein involved in cysteine biosynthesis [Sphingomonas jejuensis]